MDFTKLFDISGKIALITGGGGTLGTTIANGLATVGVNMVVADVNLESAQKTCDLISAHGTRVLPIQVDVTDPASVNSMVDSVLNEFGKIDILLNHAGINIRKPAIEYTPEEWEKVLAVNLTGMFHCAQAVGKVMLKQGKGRIVNTASTLASVSQPLQAVYASSKGGIVQLTKVLAEEWAPYGVNVNAIGPGYFETELTKKYLSDPAVSDTLLSKIPMKRFGQPDELVGTIIFLSSEASAYVTGHTVYIDGGRLLY
ncbi:MAG: SDR family NAD(P)-dependent oxidoreductase [Desulfitobacteriaceae bacterium]